MDEITVTLKNTKNLGFGFYINKSENRKSGLVVTHVYDSTPASEANIKVGDQIIKINNKSTKNGQKKLISDINESKLDNISMVIKRNSQEPRHKSTINLSSVSSLINNSIPNVRSSKSSSDLNYSCPSSKKLLDSNFVPEDTIKNFIQEDCNDFSVFVSEDSSRHRTSSLFTLEISLDGDRGDSESPQNSQQVPSYDPDSDMTSPQIIRKCAYRKQSEDNNEVVHTGPKINRKKATNTIRITPSDPVYTMKKKFNSEDQVFQPRKTLNASPRYPNNVASRPMPVTLPIESKLLGNQQNADQIVVKSLSPNFGSCQTNTSDFEDGNTMSSGYKGAGHQLLTPSSQSTLTESSALPLDMELELKIIQFKNKIAKPIWKKYSLEQEATGVMFQCFDTTHQANSSMNSTALNPAMVQVDLLMNVWEVNFTPLRFYLPIGQTRYDPEIIRVATFDEIRICYDRLRLEFSINLLKIAPSGLPNLFKLLGVEPPEPKLPPVKQKKSVSNIDQRKIKQINKPIEMVPLLTSLHKCRKVAGVPLVVIICVTIIEDIGLREEGIYRKSGNVAGKKVLEETIANENPDKWSSHEEWTNVHTTSSLLKSILRKYTLFDKDTAIKLSVIKLDSEESRMDDSSRKLQAIMDMNYHLCTHFKSHPNPEENKCRLDTFKYIIKHLYRVHLAQEHTKMNAENLATCFVPNLIEDIPSDEDTEYKSSKKSVIHENLTKMVMFWILNADTVCELLEEERSDELSRKVRSFLSRPNNHLQSDIKMIKDNSDKDVHALVKERIDYFTEAAIGSGYNSPNSLSNINTPESYFSKSKNSRLYQSVKQPKTKAVHRRNSSASPIDDGKTLDLTLTKTITKADLGSPGIPKRTDILPSSRIVRKKKDFGAGDAPGMEMVNLQISGYKKDVPLVVDACIKIIERFGLSIDGIYRISGRNQDIMILDTLASNNDIDKWLQPSCLRIWANMHNTACLMKRLLKKFCLIPKDTWIHMTSQFSEKLESEDIKNVLKAAAYYLRVEPSKSSMAPTNSFPKADTEDTRSDMKLYESRFRSGTLRYVLQHLRHVAQHEASNRMNSNSLAVCFVPVLMEEDFSKNMMVINTKCIQIVQLLIDHCDWIFQWDNKPPEDLYGQTMSDSLEKHLKYFKLTSCNQIHHRSPSKNDNSSSDKIDSCVLNVDCSEIEPLLKDLITSSFHLSDMDQKFLRIYFENVGNSTHYSSTPLSE